jgi:hypothetical protein
VLGMANADLFEGIYKSLAAVSENFCEAFLLALLG